MTFTAAHRARWGVEPICRVLQFAPATYYAARAQAAVGAHGSGTTT